MTEEAFQNLSALFLAALASMPVMVATFSDTNLGYGTLTFDKVGLLFFLFVNFIKLKV